MTVTEALQSIRYVVDSKGRKTDAVVPLAAWKTLLGVWKESVERLEDEEDLAIFRQWVEQRSAGEAEMMPLEELERELAADGLL